MEAKTALITGASSGLGWEFCRLAAADGYDLVLAARNQHRLEEAARTLRSQSNRKVEVIAKDLSDVAAAASMHDEIKQRGLEVNVLINNAGFAFNGYFAQQDVAELDAMMQANMVALTALTRLFLPAMLDRRAGRILNVASTAAFQPGPLMSVYYASKAYVLSFTEALAFELEGSGVTATVVCPGPMKTGFQARAHLHDSLMLRSPLVMDVHRVAEIGYRAMLAGKLVCVPGTLNAVSAFLAMHSPRPITARMAKKIQAGPLRQVS